MLRRRNWRDGASQLPPREIGKREELHRQRLSETWASSTTAEFAFAARTDGVLGLKDRWQVRMSFSAAFGPRQPMNFTAFFELGRRRKAFQLVLDLGRQRLHVVHLGFAMEHLGNDNDAVVALAFAPIV